MTDSQRKGSLAFLNPFRHRKPGSSPSSRNGSISDLSIDSTKDLKSPVASLRKASSPIFGNHHLGDYNGDRRSLDSARNIRKAAPPLRRKSDQYDRDEQTGERKDHTEMLHSLAHKESSESLAEKTQRLFAGDDAIPPSDFVTRFPNGFWTRTRQYLNTADAASLAFSCMALREILGNESWTALETEDRPGDKIDFLSRLDASLPHHLLCFSCIKYHARTQIGHETLRPTNVANPVFDCPNASNPEKKVPRTRITVGRSLPFTFMQLVLRAKKYTPDHGIPIDSLSRRYKDRGGTWSHQTRFAIVQDHLLMRVISSTFATPALPPAGLRRLIYSHDDNFAPYFSVCAHWRDGELLPAVKCALSHIPKPPEGSGVQGTVDKVKWHYNRPSMIVSLCSVCRPMRRCPECASEYLIEMRVAEDKDEPDPRKLFKHSLVVTRWVDLGDGSSPKSPEWAANNGEIEWSSFDAIGKRAVSGTFESQFNVDQIPGQNLISMNPNKEHLGEAGHNWY